MAFAGTGKIWMDGRLVEWKDATVHVGVHALHYGTGVFEGIRAYRAASGTTNVFRLDEHMRRLYNSCRVYRMEPRWPVGELSAAVLETVRVNGFPSCYIRPLVYRGYDNLGLNPMPCPVETAIMVWEWSEMMGAEALEKGVSAGVSSWTRVAPNTLPAMAKGTANYANSGLIKMEATLDGYDEGIALDERGTLSEGSGQNLFLVRDGVVYTPSLTSSVLQGITRDTVLLLCKDLGVEVQEVPLPREFLYLADEAFFCGTAVEITPIRAIDRITVGSGARGPVTAALQKRFFDIITGAVLDAHNWLTPVGAPVGAR
jgi:branched-chain amino acid aminotransferase